MVDEKSQPNQEIDSMNKKIEETGQPYKLAVVKAEQLEFLEKNARYMTADQFQNLVSNIKKDGQLGSVPLCWKRGDKYRVLSGNHRCQAGIQAGLTEFLVLYTDKKLTRSEEIAIQLSHNSIEGKDDPIILKDLWDEIDGVQMKYYAGLDDKTLKELENVTISPLNEVNMDFRTLSFVFLPEEVDRIEKLFDDIKTTVTNQEIYAGRLEDFDRMIDAMTKVQGSYNVHNSAVTFMVMLDLFEKNKQQLSEGWINEDPKKHKTMVPIASIFGEDNVTVDDGKILMKALQLAVSNGDFDKKKPTNILRKMAEAYLKEINQ